MKKNLKLIITIIGVIMLVGLGITVAYYSVNITGNPTADNIEIGAGTVSLQFSDGNSTINVQNVLPGWSAQKTFTVKNTSTATDAELEYNIKLVITANGFGDGSITYTLAGTGEGTTNKDETGLGTGTSEAIITGATITGTIHTYTLTLKYPNKTTDQSSEMGSTLTGYVTLEAAGGVAKIPPILAQTAIKKGEVDGLYNYGTAGYRYSGATPNNYITFNNGETWRIIGFIDGSQIGKTPGTYYTKIIRNASLGNKAWHSTTSGAANTWYTSSLYNTLNVTNDYTYKDNTNVEAVNWYHKGSNNSDVLTSTQYTAEAWGTTCNASSKDCTSNAKVGLMSPSDYGYGSSICYNTKNLDAYNDATCTGSNWLYINNTYQWLLEPNASRSDRAWYVYSDGHVYNGGNGVNNSLAVRPVVYLKSTTTISGGDGKVGSPYTIG